MASFTRSIDRTFDMNPWRRIGPLRVLLWALVVSLTIPSAARADRRVALVVGNSAYANAPALRNPTNDANDVAETLKKVGFEVVLGTDLDQGRFATTIETFARALDG